MSPTTFDDRSPIIIYTPEDKWKKKGNRNSEFDGTTSECKTPGSTATLIFNGTNIEVMGTVGRANKTHSITPMSSYSIDNDPPKKFQPHVYPNETQYNVTFFQASHLEPNASHTLVITVHNTGSFFLDWIQVDWESNSSATSRTSASPPGKNSSNEHHHPSHNNGISTDGIIAVVLGILSFVTILCAIFFFLGKKQRARKARQLERAREENMKTFTMNNGSDATHFGVNVNPEGLEEGYPAQEKNDSFWTRALWQRPQPGVEAETRSVASGPVFYAQ